MLATFFFVLAVVFLWLLSKGYFTQEIMARGWGNQVWIYRRSCEPILYWVTFCMYLVIAGQYGVAHNTTADYINFNLKTPIYSISALNTR